ncbi:MAG TPA: hypothetical protein VHM00_09140 [Caldimonas sp.]|jgi:hypothetical protein|nr:hypothetical protein [Caldimonas sp.]HEX2541233.1 hypothetical protein [Caldimonas sp.]
MKTQELSFRFIHPDSLNATVTERFIQGSPLWAAVWDALNLADAAAQFFRGYFPAESPYFSWRNGAWLPWAYLYHQQDDADRICPLPIGCEVAQIATQLSEADGPWNPSEMYRQQSFQLGSFASDELMVKGLAVETMLAVDEFIACLVAKRVDSGIPILGAAYQNIIECTCIAHRLLALVEPVTNAHRARSGIAEVRARVQRQHSKARGSTRGSTS